MSRGIWVESLSRFDGLNNTKNFGRATIENMIAATKAIIAPLPVSSSAEKYSPKKTELSPKNCVQAKHDRKLRPTNCAVAAGVTSKAVTNKVPTT